MRRRGMQGFILGAAAIAAVGLDACSGADSRTQGPPPIQVVTATVQPGEAEYYETLPATVEALNQVDLRAQVSGYISDIAFQDGQRVQKGMRLYGIDQQQFKAAYDQATANLSVAKANLVKVQQDVDRYNRLAAQDAVARQTLEHARADLESAKMQVAAAEANATSVETNLRYSVIVAPFDGVIGISLVKKGSAVTAGQTLLNTISSDDPVAVDCSVDEKEITRFTRLLNAGPRKNDSTFSLILPDQSRYSNFGHLSVLDRAVDAETGTIRVRLVFPNPQHLLRPGLTCDLRILTTSPAGVLVIPYRAVVEQMGEYFAFVVNGKTVAQRRITLGMHVLDKVVVTSGLTAGDQIVTDGVQRLHDNAIVAVATPLANGGPEPGTGEHPGNARR